MFRPGCASNSAWGNSAWREVSIKDIKMLETVATPGALGAEPPGADQKHRPFCDDRSEFGGAVCSACFKLWECDQEERDIWEEYKREENLE